LGRKQVIAEELDLDVFEQACIALGLADEQCSIMREAAEAICTEKGKKKRQPSRYNLFIAECVPKKTGPVTERFKQCAIEYKKQKEREKVE